MLAGRLESSLKVGGQGNLDALSVSAKVNNKHLNLWCDCGLIIYVPGDLGFCLCPEKQEFGKSHDTDKSKIWNTQVSPAAPAESLGSVQAEGQGWPLQKLLEIFPDLLARTSENKHLEPNYVFADEQHAQRCRCWISCRIFLQIIEKWNRTSENCTQMIFRKALFQSSEVLKLCVLHRTSHDEDTLVYFSGFFFIF